MILDLDQIIVSPEAQPRVVMDDDAVSRYAEAYRAGTILPSPVVFSDGEKYWLASGFHRIAARRAAGLDSIPCEVRRGGLRAAILFAASTNHEHGLARSESDMERAIRMVHGVVGGTWTQKQIALHCHVTQGYVSKILTRNSGKEPTIPRNKSWKIALPSRASNEEDGTTPAPKIDAEASDREKGTGADAQKRKASRSDAVERLAAPHAPPSESYSSLAARDTARAALRAVKRAHGRLRSLSDRALLARQIVALGRDLGGAA